MAPAASILIFIIFLLETQLDVDGTEVVVATNTGGAIGADAAAACACKVLLFAMQQL